MRWGPAFDIETLITGKEEGSFPRDTAAGITEHANDDREIS